MKMLSFVMLWMMCLFFAACSSVVKNPTPMEMTRANATPQLRPEYVIRAGDLLDIKFYYNPDLNEQVTVRPDGRISLQLIGEVIVTGLTPSQLTKKLIETYAPELKHPEITVIVRSFEAQKVFVDGEVARPDMFPLVGFMTVLQAISRAGGLKDTARATEVVVIRRGQEDKPVSISLNLRKVIDGTDMSQDILLTPYDIVYVPKSSIAQINVWVDQYIRKNVPIPIGMGYNLNP
jgi:protein involved in polysaccharide export with SLBB domain